MSDLRFHVPGARFLSFPRRFHAHEGNRYFVSCPFPSRFLTKPFVSYFLSIHGKRETKRIRRKHEQKEKSAC
jgi:hypothetical protein